MCSRFTSVRVTAKYHGIKLEYREHRHTVLDLLGQIRTKLHIWKKPFISSEAVRVLMQEWHVSKPHVVKVKRRETQIMETPTTVYGVGHPRN